MQSRFYRNLFGAIFASTLVYFGRRVYLSMKNKQEKKKEKKKEKKNEEEMQWNAHTHTQIDSVSKKTDLLFLLIFE